MRLSRILTTVGLVMIILSLSSSACNKYENDLEIPRYYETSIYPTDKQSISVFIEPDLDSKEETIQVQEVFKSVTGMSLVQTKVKSEADFVIDSTEVDSVTTMLHEQEYLKITRHVEGKIRK